MKFSKRSVKWPALAKISVFLLAATIAPLSLAEDVIKIAVVGPATGAVAQFGDMVFMGTKMAAEQINAAGGVNGKKLQLVTYDDACDPKQAVAVANKVVNDGIKFVVGHVCSSSTLPASDIYEDERILMVTPSATHEGITNRGYKMMFRTIGLDGLQAPAAADYIADKLKPHVVAIIHDKQQFGEGIATAVKKRLDAKGVNVVIFDGINAGEKDFSSLITKLKRANVDLLYYGGYHPEMGMILRQSAEKGFKPTFVSTDGAGNSEISAIAGAASEGLLFTQPKAFDQDPKNTALVKAFKLQNQDPSGNFVMPAYTAVEVIAEGIKAAGSEDTEKVAETLKKKTFDTPIGLISFDQKGDLKDFSYVVYTWHKDGTKTLAN
ncbi:high-affinity branched-chain amino acid ABC transporter substrate-binding protein [Pseudomonas poae]|uniref:high-affinity branched-chain amino acid ABC transporter substrate-binding protein n=1 Tax=Pseudomonas poae TaxID=200451 RepID=UPI00073BA545|nr:high-affinity branched-chain amino acid ABC transporter substrate-binding protein [Pseudomonas poae]KTC33390.1 leucine ABC transporter substrate-binding protein [Pseudomonas sp. ABAC21]NMZ52547.1 high-affinity branched-chain amino acid ABC transporter substrate-binding protein [Pseudomonas poae]